MAYTKEQKRNYDMDYRRKNKEKIAAGKKVWQQDNAPRLKTYLANRYRKFQPQNKDYNLRYNYGVSLEEYNRMLSEQHNCCKICETPQSQLKQKLSVDHCHITLKVRGLLCRKCNMALGAFRDSIQILVKAIIFLEENKICISAS